VSTPAPLPCVPAPLRLHFSGAGRTIDEDHRRRLGSLRPHIDFTWKLHAEPLYDAGLKRIVIPYRVSQSRLDIVECDSPFHGFEGAATSTAQGWALPVATIDVAHPLKRRHGGMMVQTGDGITDRLGQSTKCATSVLAQPVFLLSPARSPSATPPARTAARQRFNLWLDGSTAMAPP